MTLYLRLNSHAAAAADRFKKVKGLSIPGNPYLVIYQFCFLLYTDVMYVKIQLRRIVVHFYVVPRAFLA